MTLYRPSQPYHKPGQIQFFCPGCNEPHGINTTWTVTGTDDCPTVSPSILITSGHYVSFHKPGDPCWCTYNAANPDRPGPVCRRCHSFVRNGRIEFLSDCTHKLAGQTVDIPEYPETWK